MRHRRYLIAFSLTAHLALVLGLFVAGFWKLDRLDGGRRPFDLAVAPPPPPAPSGSPSATEHEPFKKKKPKVVPTEITQPTVVPDPEEKPATAEPTTTGGGGTGDGPGTGSGTDPKGTGDCLEEPCGPADEHAKPAPKPQPPVVEPPVPVIPAVIRGMRISGETQIQPPDFEKTALMRSGKPRANATVKVCVGETGNIVSLTMYKGSGYSGWDAAILSALRKWRYKPHRIGERAVTVCGMVTFLYEIR